MSESHTAQIILRGFPHEESEATQAALERCLHFSPGLAQKVMNAAPIAVLHGMNPRQALEVMLALQPLLEAGAALEVQVGQNPSAARLGWSKAPHICGKALARFGPQPSAKVEAPARPEPEPEPPAATEEDSDDGPLFEGLGDPLFGDMAALHDTGALPIIGVPEMFDLETTPARTARPPSSRRVQKASPTRQEAPTPAEPRGAAEESTGTYCVSVPGSGREDAVALVAELLEIDPDEAKQRLRKPVLVVARDVEHDTAESIRTRFSDIGVKAIVTQPRARH